MPQRLLATLVIAGLSLPVIAQTNLRIVVIEGEDAVNVVQQKTAVAPVIEVRDRNDQPVAGAVVSFAIRNGRATFSGARALTVTTNAAGRAVATGLTPTGSGALQISASAAFQGQTAAAVTIAQTNVMTAAQVAGGAAASSAGGASGSGAGAGTASGGAAGGAGGGGLSATTVAIVGGAVAGGTIIAKDVLADDGPSTRFVGNYSGVISDVIFAVTQTNPGCIRTESNSGTIEIGFDLNTDGSFRNGQAEVNGSRTFTGGTPGCGAVQVGFNQGYSCCDSLRVTGSSSSMQFDGGYPVSGVGGASETWKFQFTGALSGSEVAGTFTFSMISSTPGLGGTLTVPVTLQKQ